MRLLSLAIFSSVALVAQAPTTLVQRFNAELPVVNQMLKEFKGKEALAKVEGMVPAQRPAFNSASPKDVAQSLDDAQGLLSIYRLYANVASENGLWEKALEIQERRAKDVREILADLDKAQAPLADSWKKAVKDSTEYLAKNEPRKPELEAKVKAFKAEFDAVSADVKSGKRKLTKKEADDINARGAQAQLDEQELAQITALIPQHKQQIQNAAKVTKLLADNRKEVEVLIQAADDAVTKAKEALKSQNEEITKFNMEQVMKKVKITGKKNWVDAVMRNAENITKLGAPQAQVAFLNRLLVLDPGNSAVQKAIDAIVAGKDPFAKPSKSAKTGKKK